MRSCTQAPLLTDDALDKRCGDAGEIKRAVDDPTGAFSWLCFAATHTKLDEILAVKVTIKEGGHTIEYAIQHQEIEAAIRDLESGKTDDDVALHVFAEPTWERSVRTARCPAALRGQASQRGAQVSRPSAANAVVATLGANGKLIGVRPAR